jgi:hypothetical protein
MRPPLAVAAATAFAAAFAGCDARDPAPPPMKHDESEVASLPPGVIAVPQGVRDNLGIAFARVERRRVADTIRLPGRFEAAPEARAEYRSSVRGTVTLAVRQYQQVAAGDLLYTVRSPAWTIVQAALADALLAADLLAPKEEAAMRAVEAATRAVELQRSRHARLEGLHAQGATQITEVAAAASDLAEAEEWLGSALERQQLLRAEALALRDHEVGNRRFAMALHEAAALLGREEEWLLQEVDGAPRWRTLHAIEVTARRPGVVQRIAVTDGAFAGEGDLVLETLDTSAVRFRGFALQADIGIIADGAEVSIVPPLGTAGSYTEAVRAAVRLAPEADPDERTIDLVAFPAEGRLPAWARPGVAAFAEVVVAGSAEEELAIPLAAVVGDGLDRVFFLRDRENPDRVRRMVGDLGADDGRWIVVNSGVRPGDEVVLDGVHELKLAGSGKAEQGGHFHADGTFHAGEH